MSPRDERRSLPVVFWLYAVLVGRVAALAVANLIGEEPSRFVLGVILGGFYMLWAWFMTWQAADRYAGPAVWRVLAKAAVVVDVVFFASVVTVGIAVLNGFEGFWLG